MQSLAMPGIGSAYAAACRDSDGSYLDGAKTYRLTLPPNPPAKGFWLLLRLYNAKPEALNFDWVPPAVNRAE
jgi:hypothetical protein